MEKTNSRRAGSQWLKDIVLDRETIGRDLTYGEIVRHSYTTSLKGRHACSIKITRLVSLRR